MLHGLQVIQAIECPLSTMFSLRGKALLALLGLPLLMLSVLIVFLGKALSLRLLPDAWLWAHVGWSWGYLTWVTSLPNPPGFPTSLFVVDLGSLCQKVKESGVTVCQILIIGVCWNLQCKGRHTECLYNICRWCNSVFDIYNKSFICFSQGLIDIVSIKVTQHWDSIESNWWSYIWIQGKHALVLRKVASISFGHFDHCSHCS